jgi:hypothetical protein
VHQEHVLDRKIFRFRARALAGKAIYVLSVHGAEQGLKKKERLRDRLVLALGLRRVYGHCVLSEIKANAVEGGKVDFIRKRKLQCKLAHWRSRLEDKLLSRLQWRVPTLQLGFHRLKVNANRQGRVLRNLRLKFLDRWVRFVCDRVGEQVRVGRVGRVRTLRFFENLKKLMEVFRFQRSSFDRSGWLAGWLGVVRRVDMENSSHEKIRLNRLKKQFSFMNIKLKAIAESRAQSKMKESEEQETERIVYMIRSYILSLRVVKTWRSFVKKSRERKELQIRALANKVETIRQQLVALRE